MRYLRFTAQKNTASKYIKTTHHRLNDACGFLSMTRNEACRDMQTGEWWEVKVTRRLILKADRSFVRCFFFFFFRILICFDLMTRLNYALWTNGKLDCF